jgi:hypothetical protein
MMMNIVMPNPLTIVLKVVRHTEKYCVVDSVEMSPNLDMTWNLTKPSASVKTQVMLLLLAGVTIAEFIKAKANGALIQTLRSALSTKRKILYPRNPDDIEGNDTTRIQTMMSRTRTKKLYCEMMNLFQDGNMKN